MNIAKDNIIPFSENKKQHLEYNDYISLTRDDLEGHDHIHVELFNSVTSLEKTVENKNDELQRDIKRLLDNVKNHDSKSEQAHSDLNKQIDHLKRENSYFRQKLIEVHSPDKLKKASLYFAVGSLSSLGLSIFLNVNILHPMFSAAILFSSFVFYSMAIIMKKQDEQ